MNETYWGPASLIPAETDAAWFPSAIHEEAFARLEYLVEQQRTLGLLTGPAGTGKSLLLSKLHRHFSRSAHRIARVDLAGLAGDELLWELAAALNLGPAVNESKLSLWRRLNDELTGLRLARRHAAFLVDHAERAQPDCLPVLQRLIQLGTAAAAGMTIIIATRPALVDGHTAGVFTTLQERADLRIALAPLDPVATRLYLEAALRRAGGTRDVFAPGAFDELHRLTRGVPRAINRLCDLALLAAKSDCRRGVDAAVVAAAAAEFESADT
jgi:type II secretory pathway predicted ATPase ExeA